MGLILAIIVELITICLCVIIVGADAMSDAPSVQGVSVWPTFIIGTIIAGVLLLTHFFHIGW